MRATSKLSSYSTIMAPNMSSMVTGEASGVAIAEITMSTM